MTCESSPSPARRRLIAGGLVGGLAALAIAPARRAVAQTAPQPSGDVVSAAAIHQETDYAASPARLYAALLDSSQFSALYAFSGFMGGRETHIEPGVCGAFSLFGGHIVGRHLELVPGRRIVQAWRVVDWPDGVHSIARIQLDPRGAGAHLVFDHTGFPSGEAEHLASGWREHYWEPLRKLLG
jgi:activator of HSP90 ATPase